MPLTDKQRTALEAKAAEMKVDPSRLIAEAEAMTRPGAPTNASAGGEQPKLFMYLLPFVTVEEVRRVWLGLTDSFPGDSQVASAWAAKQGPVGNAPPDGESQ